MTNVCVCLYVTVCLLFIIGIILIRKVNSRCGLLGWLVDLVEEFTTSGKEKSC